MSGLVRGHQATKSLIKPPYLEAWDNESTANFNRNQKQQKQQTKGPNARNVTGRQQNAFILLRNQQPIKLAPTE